MKISSREIEAKLQKIRATDKETKAILPNLKQVASKG